MKNYKYVIYLILFLFIVENIIFLFYSKCIDVFIFKNRYKDVIINDSFKFKNKENLINIGKEHTKNKTVVIAFLCRNISECFYFSKKRIEKISDQFKDYNIIIFENDSKDNSRKLLKKWAKENPKVHLIKCKNNPDCKFNVKEGYSIGFNKKNRIDNMTMYRNMYMKCIWKNKKYYQKDFLMVIDFDLVGGISINGLHYSMAKSSKWDGISINGLMFIPPLGIRARTYDGMAFRHKWNKTQNSLIDRYILMNKLISKSKRNFIKVASSFNGLAIYHMDAVRNLYYSVPEKPYLCEHIGLHKSMYNNGYSRFYISKKFIIYAGIQGPKNKVKTIVKILSENKNNNNNNYNINSLLKYIKYL